MTSVYDYVVWGAVGVLLIPVVLNPATWVVGVIGALIVLLVGYGGRFGIREWLDIEKKRRTGEKAGYSRQDMFRDDDSGGRFGR